MAFIPDDAEDRFHELSPSAERFYIYLCKTRNHKMQVSFGTIDACAARYEWKRATRFAVVKELISKGWIQPDGNAWILLVGDFSPVNKSKNLDSAANQSENLDFQSKKSDSESKNLDSHIRNIPALPEIEPEEENLSPRAREIPKTAFGRKNGILAADVLESEEKIAHELSIIGGMKVRLGTPGGLPKEFEWLGAAHFAWINKFSPERFFQTFDLLEKIRKKKRGSWRVTAGMIENNIADLERLEIELRSLENGSDSSNSTNGNGNHRTAGKSDSEEVRSRLRARKPTDVRLR